MWISKNLGRKLTVLALGSSLFAGCSSGPQLSSIRFWPGADKMESAADDEAVAQKWRDRLNASARGNGLGTAPGFETAAAEVEGSKPRSNRFNIFRRFSRKEDNAPEETAQAQAAEQPAPNVDAQRLALQKRIAELEAEQRALQQKRAVAGDTTAAPFDPRQAGEVSDPFLAAEQMAAAQKKQIVRPPIRPTQPKVEDTTLPSWAAGDIAIHPKADSVTPDFNQTANAEPPQGTAPAMPFGQSPIITPRTEQAAAPAPSQNPFAQAAAKPVAPTPTATAEVPPVPQAPQPKLDRPVADADNRHRLQSLRSAEELQRNWAQLEVNNLMKHSRAQARAGQLNEALTTALAAEQLANSAKIEFYDGVQTPSMLVSLIRLKASETPETAAKPSSPAQEAVADKSDTQNLPAHPLTRPNDIAQQVTTKTVTPPQWPGRFTAIEPQQVEADRPAVATPGASRISAPDQHLKTAEFVHPRPAQSVEPRALTSDQWHSANNHPLTEPTTQRSGGYIEAPAAARPSRNGINAQFVSSTTIYSPENLQWTSLEESRATILEEDRIPAPPVTVQQSLVEDALPPFAESQGGPPAADPFSAVFDQQQVSDTPLSPDNALREFGPTIPTGDNAAEAAAEEATILGIPVRKLLLVLLAGMILLAAIIHRRRTNDLHEL